MAVAELAVFEFPAASVNVAPATEMDPEPVAVSAVGVNTTEYTVDDVAVNDDSVPPDTVMSPTAKSVAASDSVKVMVSVWPDLSVPEPVCVSDTVGTEVSTLTTSAVLEVCVSAIPSKVVVAVERIL
jgi:hypothetical protein